MEKKKQRMILPNECSPGRWFATLLVGLGLGVLLCIPVAFVYALLPGLQTGHFCGVSGEMLMLLLAFAAMFWGLVIALRLIAKCSLRDFVLGVGGRVNIKECLLILGLYLLGMLAATLLTVGNIRPRGVTGGEFAALLLLMLAVIWMQTGCEELVFRGFFIRWACGNDIGFTPRAITACFVSTVLFALAHITNVEVTSQGGFQMLLAILTYTVPGIMMYIANLYFKSLLPGILIHWLNNFFSATLVGGEVSSLSADTLFVDVGSYSGGLMLLSTAVCYVPLLIYMLVDYNKKKTSAAESACD